MIDQFDVYLVGLDPTLGSEMKKTRPCVVLSPKPMNYLNTVLVAPLTSQIHGFRFRVRTEFDGLSGELALDQIRAVDKKRLIKKLGALSNQEQNNCLDVLQAMFAKDPHK
jgi:mRNA interferase MazF